MTAIENGIADLSDPKLKDRVAELKATRDQARLDADRAGDAIDRAGPTITPQTLRTFARTARKRMRTENGGYRRDHLHALAQRIEVDKKELRIMGSKKRASAYARRRFKRKNGWFWRAQFCTEVARHADSNLGTQARPEPARNDHARRSASGSQIIGTAQRALAPGRPASIFFEDTSQLHGAHCFSFAIIASSRPAHVIVSGEDMAFHDVEELVDRYMLVDAAHAGR
jgi:hypothetical protein